MTNLYRLIAPDRPDRLPRQRHAPAEPNVATEAIWESPRVRGPATQVGNRKFSNLGAGAPGAAGGGGWRGRRRHDEVAPIT